MRKITAEEIFELLEAADCFTVDDSPLLTSYTHEGRLALTGEADEELFMFTWSDAEGLEYRVSFTEEGVNNAVLDDHGTVCLADNEGEPSTITFFKLKRIPE